MHIAQGQVGELAIKEGKLRSGTQVPIVAETWDEEVVEIVETDNA